jgi:hypothetical protein
MALDLVLCALLSVSGPLTLLTLFGVPFATGGWEVAATELSLASGVVFSVSLIALLLAGDRTTAEERA